MDPRFVMPAPGKHRKPGVDLCAEAREVGLLYALNGGMKATRQDEESIEW